MLIVTPRLVFVMTSRNLGIPLGPGTSALLPPCGVCGASGTGYHYGAVTCNSCRLHHPPERCRLGSECMIDRSRGSRKTCVPCRYEKCRNIGMKKSGKKSGRYTYAQRTDFTETVQAMTLRKQVSASSSRTKVHMLTDEERVQELDRVIQHITDVYMEQPNNKTEFMEELKQREDKFMDKMFVESALFGDRTPIPKEDYDRVYNCTGIDIDGRRQHLRDMMPSFNKAVHRYVKFTAEIPGFANLPRHDQSIIFKASVFENDLFGSYNIFNLDLNAWNNPDDPNSTVGLYELTTFFDTEKLNQLRYCIDVLQKLDLTPEEQAMLYAYTVLTADVELSSEGTRLMAAILDTVLDAFFHLLRRHHDNVNMFFSCVISAVLVVKDSASLWFPEYSKLLEVYSDVEWTPMMHYLFKSSAEVASDCSGDGRAAP